MYTANACSEVSVEATIVRCTCTAEQKAASTWHGAMGQPCPQGRTRDLGRLSYWHRNPLRRLAWRIGQLLRGRWPGELRNGLVNASSAGMPR